LERVERGEATIEQVLGEYPAFRSELEPLLRLAQDIRSLPKVQAPERLRSSKRPVFCPPKAVRPAPLKPRWGASPIPGWKSISGSPFARLAAGFAAAILLLGGTTAVSAGSLPEEPLYPLKLAVEDFQLAIAPRPETRSELELQFVSRRLEEVESAARQGRSGSVQRGLALYEEKVGGALQRAESTTPASVESAVEQQQQLLTRVLDQVPEQAKPNILHAMEASSRGRAPFEKAGSAVGLPAVSDVPATTTASPRPMAAASAATAATVVPLAVETQEPAGKAKRESTPTPATEERERKPKEKDAQLSYGVTRPESPGEENPSPDSKHRGHSSTSTPAPAATDTTPAVMPATSVNDMTATPTPTADRRAQGLEKDHQRVIEPTPKPGNNGRQDPHSKNDTPSYEEDRGSSSNEQQRGSPPDKPR